MKSADGWQDVAIQNVSAHGLKISVALPPSRGAYIEIRRASQVIVARTMWVQNNECGLRTQDVVDVPALLNPNAARAEAAIAGLQSDRRAAPRVDETAARSARFAQKLQALVLAAAVAGAAVYAGWMVRDVLTKPFSVARAALSGSTGSGEPEVRTTP